MGKYRYCRTGMTEKERYGNLLEKTMKKEEEKQKKYEEIIASYKTIRMQFRTYASIYWNS